MQALDLVVELGVFEGQGDELADGLGGGDLFGGERAFDAVEQTDEADRPCRARQAAARRSCAARSRACSSRSSSLSRGSSRSLTATARPVSTASVAGPLARERLAGPPSVSSRAPSHGRGDADEAPVVVEAVDVAVGDLQRGAQAPRRRLQDLADLEARSQFEARLEQELIRVRPPSPRRRRRRRRRRRCRRCRRRCRRCRRCRRRHCRGRERRPGRRRRSSLSGAVRAPPWSARARRARRPGSGADRPA